MLTIITVSVRYHPEFLVRPGALSLLRTSLRA
jgi:hypothetical protein